MRAPTTWQQSSTPLTFTSITRSNDVLGIALERPDLLRRRIGRRVERGVVDEQVRHAPLVDHRRRRLLDRRAVGDVDSNAIAANESPSAPGSALDVEDGDAHPARREPRGVCRAELAQAAGDDGDAPCEIEERVCHGLAEPLR